MSIKDSWVIGAGTDPAAWPTLVQSRIHDLKIGRGNRASAFVIADTTLSDVSTPANLVLLACALKRVTLRGRVGAITIRQYGGLGLADLAASAVAIAQHCAGDWALDLSGLEPTGQIELSLAVEPWQVIPSEAHSRIISRAQLERLSYADIQYVGGVDQKAADTIGIARSNACVRTCVAISLSPNPAWFSYLDSRNLTWKPAAS